MFNINYNNFNSYYDLGLGIERRPIIPVPSRKINEIEVPGRHGALTEDEGTYGNVEISLNFGFVDRNNFLEKCRAIKKWLIGDIENNSLIFSDDTECFYKVKYVKSDNIDRALRVLGRFTTNFVCEPFSYLQEGLNPIEITQVISLYNPGTYYSEPILKVYGTGNITLNINNKLIQLFDVVDHIIIDSTAKIAYKDTTALNNKMVGEFPILLEGENIFSWVGNVSKIEITPNWRCL